MDFTLIALFGGTCAVYFYPNATVGCISTPAAADSPFGSDWVFSIGLLITALLMIPLGYWNLDENMSVQVASAMFTILIGIVWTTQFVWHGENNGWGNVPIVGPAQTLVLGNILFNWAYVVSLPSWINEKKPSVSVKSSIWSAAMIAGVFYLIFSLLGGFAYYNAKVDLLPIMMSPRVRTSA